MSIPSSDSLDFMVRISFLNVTLKSLALIPFFFKALLTSPAIDGNAVEMYDGSFSLM